MNSGCQAKTLPLPDKVCCLIRQNGLIVPGSRVLAAVSGGADSTALLLILYDLQKTFDFELSCVHVHHGLRGADADEDEIFVRDWCRRLAVPFYSRKIPPDHWSSIQKTGLELAARKTRGEIFRKLADELSRRPGQDRCPVRVALAHHLDDQAETLLMHLGRGTGLDGLSGMRPTDGFLIRPLLSCRRAEIEAWLEQKKITWRHDRTNDDSFTIRNRLRHQVLPCWQQSLGYDPVALLGRAAENMALDRSFLVAETEKAFAQCRQDDGLSAAMLVALHPALQVRVLRRFWLCRTGHGQNLAQAHLMKIINWLETAKSGQTLDLPENCRIRYTEGQIVLSKPDAKQATGQPETLEPVRLTLPGLTQVAALGLQVNAEFIENAEEIVYNGAMDCFWHDRIRHCVLRTRRPGDRIHPWGRSGGKTLKKFLQERHVPVDERARLILLADGREVAWLPGYASGKAYVARPGGSGGRMIRLQLSLFSQNGNTRTG